MLLSLGCGGILYTSERTVRRDVEAHLSQRYGREFRVENVNNQSNEGVGFVDNHAYTAHPSTDPDLSFRGQIYYGDASTKITDNYLCAQVVPSLEKQLASQTIPGILLFSRFSCKNEQLDLTLDPSRPLEGITWEVELRSFSDAPVDEVIRQAHTALLATAAALRVPNLQDDHLVYPRALMNSARRLHRNGADDLSCYLRGRSDFHSGQVKTTQENRKVAMELDAQLRPHLPPGVALQVLAWNHHDLPDVPLHDIQSQQEHLRVELRLGAVSSVPPEQLDAFTDASLPILGKLRWWAYLGVYEPFKGSFWEHPEAYRQGWVWFWSRHERRMTTDFVVGPSASL